MNSKALLILLLILKENYCQSDQKCENYAKDINFYRPTISYKSPNPAGTWMSTRCENIPYNKFIIRRFDIQASAWSNIIYHYSDTWCTKPTFHVKIEGTYEMLPATATPNSKSSFSARFQFQKISVYTRSSKVLKSVINFVLEKCRNALPSMQHDKHLKLDKFVDKNLKLEVAAILKKKHCRYYFVFHPNTYKKIRMVGEDSSTRTKEYDILYFGSISSFKTQYNPMYVSTRFQYGLSRLKRPDCDTCKSVILNGVNKIDKPPVLKIPASSKYFTGSWVTETCEADDDTTFFSKFYKFIYTSRNMNSGKFAAQENMFSDVDCKIKKFVNKYGGIFSGVVPKRNRQDIYEATLKVNWMTLNIYDDATMSLVRNGGCGDPTEWRIGVEQNVTSTNGCSTLLGFGLPSTIKLLVRVLKTKTKQQLYESPIEQNKETFFTSNLISCNFVTENLKKRVTATRPAPPKHSVPTVKNFDIDDEYNNSAISRNSLRTSFYLIICILYCIFYLAGISY